MGIRMQVTIDCADPGVLAQFWALALDYVLEPPPDGFESWNEYWRSVGVPEEELSDAADVPNSVVDPDGVGPRVWFQQVPEGKAVKNRLHIDVTVSGGRTVALETRKGLVDAHVAKLLAAGAVVHHRHDGEVEGHYAVTMLDPERNEFCVH